MELSTAAIALLIIVALGTGISKTGVPGLGIVFVVLTPLAIPAKESTGYILPFLIFGDCLAVLYWRRSAVWRHILAVAPAMCAGVVLGFVLMGRLDDAVYGKVLGIVVLALLGLDAARRHFHLPLPVTSRAFGYGMGLLAGVLTMLANAAGPVTMLYLLAMDVSKEEFIGTGAWLFFFINLFKVPFSAALGLMTWASFKVNLMLLPCVLLGGLIGVWIVRRIPAQVFERLMRGLTFLGGLKLLF